MGGEVKTAVLLAPAKLNLMLRIVRRREDGFHELETVMQTISLADELQLERLTRPGIELETDSDLIPDGEENLVWQGARLFFDLTGFSGGIKIRLTKKVPAGGGLGGGSADLGALLLGMNQLWGNELDTDGLRAMAARLGSDTAFFVTGGRAICRGRGELIEPTGESPSFHCVLVVPPFACPTPLVYRHLRLDDFSKEGRFQDGLGVMIRNGSDPRDWVFNDLESAACRAVPALGTFQRYLATIGLEHFRLSGSGSTLFRLFHELEDALAISCRARELLQGKAIVHLARQVPGSFIFSNPDREEIE